MNHTAVILANGEFPARKNLQKLLQETPAIICCDGAAENLHRFGRAPDVIIGDLDSFPETLKQLYHTRIIKVDEQETNDLAKAFRYAVRQNFKKIILLGATGKREDHTLGNISLLPDFAKIIPDVKMMTDYGTFLPLLHSGSIETVPGQQISIFGFDPEMPVSSSGLKYPLQKLKLKRWWQATLNEATDYSFRLEFPGPAPLVVFMETLPDEA